MANLEEVSSVFIVDFEHPLANEWVLESKVVVVHILVNYKK